MITHDDLVQGTPAWHTHRATHFNASDAPAMMGCSPYETRTQLIHRLHTGIVRDVDSATQKRFDDGHRFEAMARPLAEEIIGDSLYPVTGSEGELSASFDGLTMAEDIGFEHKSINTELRGIQHFVGQELPLVYRVQMEQQLAVSGAERILFMASKWDGDTLAEERHCWYAPDLGLRAKIVSGWVQLAIDKAAYAPTETVAEAVGRAPETLPALRIEVTGIVTASNLAEFKQTALAVFAGINRELTTDAEFANAEKTVKWCGDVEERLAAAKQHALSQTASIDDLFRTIDDISAEARAVRLELDKLIKTRKEQVRGEIVAGGIAELRKHIDSLNTRLGRPYMPTVAADFAGAIKGKRTVDSLRDAVSTTLANAKILASAAADHIQANLTTLREFGSGYKFLFADVAQIVLKAPDDLTALVKLRISEHQAAEEKRIADDRERIRKEEIDRLDREADAKALADKQAQDAIVAAQATPVPAPVPVQPMVSTVTVRQVDRPLFQPASTVMSVREQINARLDNLSDADLPRILSFLKSRYPQEVAA